MSFSTYSQLTSLLALFANGITLVLLVVFAGARLGATALVGAMKVLVPLADLIDKEAERKRLGKDIEKATQNLRKAEGKLANADFVSNAPPSVVAQERKRIAQFQAALANLDAQLAKIEALPD